MLKSNSYVTRFMSNKAKVSCEIDMSIRTGSIYSRPSMLEHRWLVYHGCFELVLESIGKNPVTAGLE